MENKQEAEGGFPFEADWEANDTGYSRRLRTISPETTETLRSVLGQRNLASLSIGYA